jgi:hypothetical protein
MTNLDTCSAFTLSNGNCIFGILTEYIPIKTQGQGMKVYIVNKGTTSGSAALTKGKPNVTLFPKHPFIIARQYNID